MSAPGWSCPLCGGPAKIESQMSATSWLILLAGILLAPICIGLFLIPIGLFDYKERRAVCQSCRAVCAELG